MRLDQLTFTRFIAAVAIVIYHFGKRVYPFNTPYVDYLVQHANLGVSYFFILSGFVMIISYGRGERINPTNYLKNRFARIYPIYLLALLFYLPIRFMIDYPLDIILISQILMLQSWIPGWSMGYNFTGWSVSNELFFYVLFPFLFNYIYRLEKYRKVVFIAVIIFWIISQAFFHFMLHQPFYKGDHTHSHDILFYFPLMHLNEFLIGNIAGIWFLRNYKNFQKSYDLHILIIIILIALALKFPMNMNYHNGLFAFLLVPLILFISLNTGRITKWFCNQKLIYLGEVSYGIYIYQLPVFYYLKKLPIDNSFLALIIKLIVLIFISMLSYRYIEIPLRNSIKKIDFNFFKS